MRAGSVSAAEYYAHIVGASGGALDGYLDGGLGLVRRATRFVALAAANAANVALAAPGTAGRGAALNGSRFAIGRAPAAAIAVSVGLKN